MQSEDMKKDKPHCLNCEFERKRSEILLDTFKAIFKHGEAPMKDGNWAYYLLNDIVKPQLKKYKESEGGGG
jgi:hypothetical protein